MNLLRPILDSSPDLSYILGVLYGDGCVYAAKQYHIILSTVDKPFAESFKESLNQIGLHSKLYLRKYSDGKRKNQWLICGCSKIFTLWFKKLSINDLERIACLYPIDFIRGFYESEGHVNVSKSLTKIYRRIFIDNTNGEMTAMIYELLRNQGFHPTFRKFRNPPWKDRFRVRLSRKQEVDRFLFVVNPCIKRGA